MPPPAVTCQRPMASFSLSAWRISALLRLRHQPRPQPPPAFFSPLAVSGFMHPLFICRCASRDPILALRSPFDECNARVCIRQIQFGKTTLAKVHDTYKHSYTVFFFFPGVYCFCCLDDSLPPSTQWSCGLSAYFK